MAGPIARPIARKKRACGPRRTPSISPPAVPRIPRPQNKFILYRTDKVKELKHSNLTQPEISKIISKLWKDETSETRQNYTLRAATAREVHKQTYPGYRYVPKRKAQEDQEGISNGSRSMPIKGGAKRTLASGDQPQNAHESMFNIPLLDLDVPLPFDPTISMGEMPMYYCNPDVAMRLPSSLQYDPSDPLSRNGMLTPGMTDISSFAPPNSLYHQYGMSSIYQNFNPLESGTLNNAVAGVYDIPQGFSATKNLQFDATTNFFLASSGGSGATVGQESSMPVAGIISIQANPTGSAAAGPSRFPGCLMDELNSDSLMPIPQTGNYPALRQPVHFTTA